jgi:glycosyltransferase involved in cell wall biosynthesis
MRNVSEQLPIEFSIVVPTFNEKDNVEKLIEGIAGTQI